VHADLETAVSRKALIADTRREAYAEYLTAVYSFADRARDLLAALDTNSDMTACDAAHRAYHEGRVNLQPKYAPVLISGPSKIEGSAENCTPVLAIWLINATNGMRPGKRQ
jgi:hypothetical protein